MLASSKAEDWTELAVLLPEFSVLKSVTQKWHSFCLCIVKQESTDKFSI